VKKLYLLISLALLTSAIGFSQGETNIWYFGVAAGLDFNTLPATALTDGKVNAHGGSSVVSDVNGNLLFYTQGMTVWDRNHDAMPNGTFLEGHASSTQNSIIIGKPGSNDIYYVFTNGQHSDGLGLKYSEVDMTLNGGLGDVTSNKNIQLLDSTAEKLTATYHSNQNDVWVITHERNTANFYAYKVSALGIGSPVVSTSGVIHDGIVPNSDVLVGQMKASPDGSQIAVATSAIPAGGSSTDYTFELLDFDNFSGVVSNPLTISGSQYEYPYGVEFSPDGTVLYCSTTENNKVFQFNLQAGTPADIINSEVLVAESASSTGGLQIGPDSRVYLGRYNSFYLGAFNNPNTVGTGCNYVDDGLSLGTKRSRRGLPNFITSYFNNPRFLYYNTCFGDTTVFQISDLNGVVSVSWDFGDPLSGANNTSTSTAATHVFSAPGSYDVTLTRVFATFSDNVTQTINIRPLPLVDLGPNEIFLCEGDSTDLFAGNGFQSYLWANGSVTPSLTNLVLPGTYTVTVTDDFGCKNSDSATITNVLAPEVDLGADTYICEGNSFVLIATFDQATYAWSNGFSGDILNVTQQGLYAVTVTNLCGEAIDSINVDLYDKIVVDLGQDQEICPGDTITLDPGNLGVSYSWSTGAVDQTIDVTSSGEFSLMAFYPGINCPQAHDTVAVVLLDVPSVFTGNDTIICQGESATLNASGNFVTNFNWSNGSSGQSISVTESGLYLIYGSNICSSDTDSVYVGVVPSPIVTLGPDTSIFDDETIQLEATYNSSWSYNWTPETWLSGTTGPAPETSPEQSISYTLIVTDTAGCQGSATIFIEVSERPLPEIVIYNTFSPNGDLINDVWVIENIEKYETSYLEIYNRNGNLIFSAENYQNDWNGTYNDNPVPAHTYFYLLDLGVPGEKIRNGHVTIIR
jgi:gliding motility-associated-like protein